MMDLHAPPRASTDATSTRRSMRRPRASTVRRPGNPAAVGVRVWAVIAVLAAAASFATFAAFDRTAALGDARIPIWVLLPAFALVEAFPVHVQFRSEASSFSLFEVPLILGVLLADASAVLPAAAIGSVAVLALVRRQPLPKLLFNGANQALQAALTILLFDALVGPIQPLSPVGSLLLLAAAVIASAQGVVAIGAVIVAAEGRMNVTKLLNTFGFGVIVAGANVSLALIAAVLFHRDPWTTGLLAVPIAVVYGSYRAFVAERAQRERVEFLYTSTRSLQAVDPELGIPEFLAEVSAMFRCRRVDIVLLPATSVAGAEPARYSFEARGDVTITQITDLVDLSDIGVGETGTALVVDGSAGGPIRDVVPGTEGSKLMTALLSGESRVFGLLVAVGPIGVAGSFSEADLRLFGTLAAHAAAVLANERLERALSQQQALERELSYQANHDSLTGLPNRSLLRRTIDGLLAARAEFELLFIDLDDFKLVNDTLGHARGDELLVGVAARIEACLQPDDVAARLGGDEFAVIVHGAGRGLGVAGRIIDEIHRPSLVGGNSMEIGCSIGVALADGEADVDTGELLRRADTAMYEAKEAGKGSVAAYSRNRPAREDARIIATTR